MPPADEHKEQKVQKALALLRENPGMKIAEAAHRTRASYGYVQRRKQGH